MILSGLLFLATRYRCRGDPLSEQAAEQLSRLRVKIPIDQESMWTCEITDSKIADIVRFVSLQCQDGWEQRLHAYVDQVRALLVALSRHSEMALPREHELKDEITVDSDAAGKNANRKLLAYEIANGRTELRSSPLRHLLDTTSRCNLRCLTCHQSATQDVVHYDIADVAYGAITPAIRYADQVMLAGMGETLLSRSAPTLISAYKRAGAYVEIITNGTTLGRTARLAAAIDVILVSFDGGTAASYNAVRRYGDFERLLGLLSGLDAESRRKICLNFVVTKQNVFTARECLSIAGELGLGQVHFQEMSSYLSWHHLMAIDDCERAWFFTQFPAWAEQARAAGVHAVCQLVEAYDPGAAMPIEIEERTRHSIAALSHLPFPAMPQPGTLDNLLYDLKALCNAELPSEVEWLGRAIAAIAPPSPEARPLATELVDAAARERESLMERLDRGEAKLPHCLSTFAHIFVNGDGTTRPCCTLQTRLAFVAADGFSNVRNSRPNMELRGHHVRQMAPRKECSGCRDPLRFHFLVEILEELASDGIDISMIRAPDDFPLPASIAAHPLVQKLGPGDSVSSTLGSSAPIRQPGHQNFNLDVYVTNPGVISVTVPGHVETATLRSITGRKGTDQRLLGALVGRLQIDNEVLELHDARLSAGFHQVERHGLHLVRWTAGRGRIALGKAASDRVLTIEVAAILAPS
jgi:MoaA/NifB/PqqE/SkfB family radical SAM enzyme